MDPFDDTQSSPFDDTQGSVATATADPFEATQSDPFAATQAPLVMPTAASAGAGVKPTAKPTIAPGVGPNNPAYWQDKAGPGTPGLVDGVLNVTPEQMAEFEANNIHRPVPLANPAQAARLAQEAAQPTPANGYRIDPYAAEIERNAAGGSGPFAHEFGREVAELPAAAVHGLYDAGSSIQRQVQSIQPVAGSDPRVQREQAAAKQVERDKDAAEMLPAAPTLPTGQGVREFTKVTAETGPLLYAAAPLAIPGRIGQAASTAARAIGASPTTAAITGGVTAAAGGAMEFGAAAGATQAAQTGDPSAIAEGVAAPIVSLGRLLPGGEPANEHDWVNAGFMVLGGLKGLGDLNARRARLREYLSDLADRDPAMLMKAREGAAASNNPNAAEFIAAADDVMTVKAKTGETVIDPKFKSGKPVDATTPRPAATPANAPTAVAKPARATPDPFDATQGTVNAPPRNPAQERPVASGAVQPGATRPVDAPVSPVVGDQGQPPVAQPRDVDVAPSPAVVEVQAPPPAPPTVLPNVEDLPDVTGAPQAATGIVEPQPAAGGNIVADEPLQRPAAVPPGELPDVPTAPVEQDAGGVLRPGGGQVADAGVGSTSAPAVAALAGQPTAAGAEAAGGDVGGAKAAQSIDEMRQRLKSLKKAAVQAEDAQDLVTSGRLYDEYDVLKVQFDQAVEAANRATVAALEPKASKDSFATLMQVIQHDGKWYIYNTAEKQIVDAAKTKEAAVAQAKEATVFYRKRKDAEKRAGQNVYAESNRAITVKNIEAEERRNAPPKSITVVEERVAAPTVAKDAMAAPSPVAAGEAKARKHHVAIYSGKTVDVGPTNPKDDFRYAAMRVADNAGEGYVVTPKNEVFKITKASRRAKPVTGKERDDVLAKVIPAAPQSQAEPVIVQKGAKQDGGEKLPPDPFAGEKFRLVNRESGSGDQTPPKPKPGLAATLDAAGDKAKIFTTVTPDGKVHSTHASRAAAEGEAKRRSDLRLKVKEKVDDVPIVAKGDPAFGGKRVNEPDAPKLASAPPLSPPPGQRVSGRQGGASTIPVEAAAEIIGLTTKLVNRTKRIGEASPKMMRWLMQRGTNWMKQLGPAGKDLAKNIEDIDFRVAKRENNTLEDIRAALKGLNKAQREQAMKSLNMRPSADNAPAAIKERGDAVRAILDKYLLDEAKKLGFMRQFADGSKAAVKGSGKAFPQMPNEEGVRVLDEAEASGLASPRVYRTAEKMVAQGSAATLDDALAKIREFRESQRRGVNQYLERTRVELPEELVEWDPERVLPNTVHRAAMTLEGVREWGMDFPKQKALIEKINVETKDAGVAEAIDDFLAHHFGTGGKVSKFHNDLSGAVSNYQVLMKLGFSPLSALRNMGQPLSNTVRYPLPVILKAYAKMPPIIWRFWKEARALREAMIRSGAVRGQSSIANIEQNAPGSRLTNMAMTPFSTVEMGNQVRAALVAKYGIERDLLALAQLPNQTRAQKLLRWLMSAGNDSEAAIRRRLADTGLTDQQIADAITSGKPLTDDQRDAAMAKFVLDTQFPVTLATERIWWATHPWMKLWLKFKVPFGADQTGFIFKNVLREAWKGNFGPLMRFAITTMIVGELYNIVRDNLVGDEQAITTRMLTRPDTRNVKDVSVSLLKNMVDGGGVGMLADMIYGIPDMMGGPAISSAANFARMTTDMARNRDIGQFIDAAKDFASREFSAGKQMEGAANYVERKFSNADRIDDYKTWRLRTYEFLNEKEEDPIGEFFGDMFGGKPDYERTGRTLAYDYAARQIAVGDVDDAADYLASVFRDAADDGERVKILRGVRGSMKSKSPLGKVSEARREQFLSKFTPEQRAEAQRAQQKWLSNYSKAIEKAWKMTTKNGR